MTAPDINPQFGDNELSVSERKVLRAAIAGTTVDLKVGDTELDDPTHGVDWGPDRIIRAELLIELLTGKQFSETGRPRAIKIGAARITGQLDLEAAELICPLLLANCYIEQPVKFDEATALAIRLRRCRLPVLTANQLRTTGDLELAGAVFTEGKVSLAGARIGGELNFSGASLTNTNGYALDADLLTVDQDMYCDEEFSAQGEIRLIGAHIGGQLNFNGARLFNPNGYALFADRLTVDQTMFCANGFSAQGEVCLAGARIGGGLGFSGASLTNTNGHALNANSLTVGQGMYCGDGFSAQGEVSLNGACISGQLSFRAASLSNPNGYALAAEWLSVDQIMFCDEGFSAQGEVILGSAQIGGQLRLRGARLSNSNGPALSAERLTVTQDMLCDEGFSTQGEINLSGASVGGELNLKGATLTHPNKVALNLNGANIAALLLTPKKPLNGVVDLTNTQVGIFGDEQETWPPTLRLHGFAYNAFANDKIDVRDRLRWLTRHPGSYVPHIYDQLADAYRRAGREDAARQVAIAKQWRRRTVLGPAGKATNWLLYLTVGYGYRTWLAAVWLVGLLALGTWMLADADSMTRTDANAPTFNPLAYTLDALLPLGDLGQQKAWQPQGADMYLSWVLMAAGWVLTTAVVAGLTGILKRD